MIEIIEKLNSLDDLTTLTPANPWRFDREGISDLVFDLLRAAAHPVGEDDHLVLGEVGNRIDRHGKHRADARDAQNEEPRITRNRLRIDHSIIASIIWG